MVGANDNRENEYCNSGGAMRMVEAVVVRSSSELLTGTPPLIPVCLANLWRALFVPFSLYVARSWRRKFQPTCWDLSPAKRHPRIDLMLFAIVP
jgi:hypothetical protein